MDTSARLQALKRDGEQTAVELRQLTDLGKRLRGAQDDTLAAVEQVNGQHKRLAQLTEATLAAQEQLAERQAKHAAADMSAHEHLQAELSRAAETSLAARTSLEELSKAHAKEANEARGALSALAEAATETHKRQERLSEVLDRVENLQGVLAAEFLDTNRLYFYLAAFGMLILITAAKRVAPVRLPSLLLLAVSFAVERNAPLSLLLMSPFQVPWLIRSVFCSATMLLFGLQAYRYQDESVRLRQVVADQTQQVLMKFFADNAPSRWSQYTSGVSDMMHAESKPKKLISRTPSRRRLV